MSAKLTHYLDENYASWIEAVNYLAHCPRDDEAKTLAFINEINYIRHMFILQGAKDAR